MVGLVNAMRLSRLPGFNLTWLLVVFTGREYNDSMASLLMKVEGSYYVSPPLSLGLESDLMYLTNRNHS